MIRANVAAPITRKSNLKKRNNFKVCKRETFAFNLRILVKFFSKLLQDIFLCPPQRYTHK